MGNHNHISYITLTFFIPKGNKWEIILFLIPKANKWVITFTFLTPKANKRIITLKFLYQREINE